MELITQPPSTSKKFGQTGGSVSTSIDGGDVGAEKYNLSVVDSQASEALHLGNCRS